MRDLPRFAARPVGAVTAVLVLVLAVTANQYGYHRDELYFRVVGSHLAWGYVDQPPVTPLLARLGIALFGDNLVAVRIPTIICAGAIVVVGALLARELGGGTAAQTLTAVALAATPGVLVAGHVLATATPDIVAWTLVILFACRALLRGEPRWWLAAGLTVGIGLYNKQLVVLLLVGLAAGLLISGPRRELRSPWLWAGVGIAAVVGAPNLVYQATHHWPELTMSRVIAADKGPDDRTNFLPLQLLLIGFPMAVVWIVGLVRLLRDAAWRPVRAFAWAYLVACVVTLVTGGQPYYPFGLLVFLFTAGCVVVARWAAGRRLRWAWPVAGVVVTGAVALVVALPLVPLSSLGSTAVPALNPVVKDAVGWPVYVRQVADVVTALPPADRAQAVLLTLNYGEAGALARYGPQYGLPAVYSGHNQLYYYGPPPDTDDVAVVVGIDQSILDRAFTSCTKAGELNNELGVDNEEQGRSILVCHGPKQPWHLLWPEFQHYG
ncbi:MAG TPA: glycosyltransferase family 39 protein [Rugosimonospora sp.]|nr:glycosyltransferase family 39 protein [Rugosimonospora sp.]